MSELTLSKLLDILRTSIIYIVVAVIVCAAGAYCYCEFLATPTYKAGISFIGANSSGFAAQTGEDDADIKATDISASRALILTYIELFKTTKFYDLIAEKSGLNYSSKQIKSMVNFAQRAENSLFIDVSVTCVNPKHAVQIAETIYDLGDEYLVTQLPNAYVKAIEDTNSTAYQNYPVASTTMMGAALVGAALVFGVAVIIAVMDKTIKGEKDFESKYDIPILGSIPNFKSAAREEKK